MQPSKHSNPEPQTPNGGSSTEDLSFPDSKLLTRVPQHVIGATGRIWSLPAPYEVPHTAGRLPTFSFSQAQAIDALVLFLASNAPETAQMWQRQLVSQDSYSARLLNAAYERLLKVDRLSIVPEAPLQFAPTRVVVPKLNDKHWAWSRHYELGHGVSSRLFEPLPGESETRARTREELTSRERSSEARSDSGENLYNAVAGASLTSVYQTCMELCFRDLALPSHFLSLVHYGMSVEFVVRGQPSPEAALVLGRLVSLYLEDFAP
jgi:hypothetical protein